MGALHFFYLLSVLLTISCGEDVKTPFTSPSKKTNKSTSNSPSGSTSQKPKDQVNRIPERQIRRLTLDLQNRLPNEHDLEIYKTDIDTAESLIRFYLASSEADNAVALLHKNFWKLWRPKSLEVLSEFDSSLKTTLETTNSQVALDEPVKLLRFLLSSNEPFEKIFSRNYTLMDSTTATLYSQTLGTGPNPDVGTLFYNDISRPNMGLLSTFGWNAALSKSRGGKNISGAADSVEKLSCINLRSSSAHNFTQAKIDTIDSDMLSYSTANTNCTSCHNQFNSLALGVPFFASSTSFNAWKSYDAAIYQSGIYRGKKFNTVDDLANLIATDSKILSCELKNVAEELLQRPIDSLADQSLMQSLYFKWKQTRNIKELITNILEEPEYSHQILGSASAKTNSLSSIRLLGPSHWEGFISQYLPIHSLKTLALLDPTQPQSATNPEVIAIVDLVQRQYFNSYAKTFIPSGSYSNAIFDLTTRIADALVKNDLNSTILAKNRKILTRIPDTDGYSASDTEITNQIIDSWNKWTSITITSSDSRVTKLKAIYAEAITNGSTDLDKSRNAWKWTLAAILMSPEFVTY
jgi:hypothetical protein